MTSSGAEQEQAILQDVPRTMTVSRLLEPGRLELREEPVPTPGPREVLVRITAVGVCGSDTHYFTDGRIGDFVVRDPLVLGHEPAGRVVAVGDGVASSLVGRRVSLEPGVPHAFSPETLSGTYHLDPQVEFFATPPVDGAFREYLVHPVSFAHLLPDSLSDEAGALLEPLSVGLSATKAAEITLGSRVLVIGAGPVGLLAAQCAALAGATEVIVSDTRADRLAVAQRYGATRTLNPLGSSSQTAEDRSRSLDAVIDASGVESAIRAAIAQLAPRGRLVLVGMGNDELMLPVSLIQQRELRVTGTFRYANTWPTAIALATSGAVDLDALVTSRHSLGDAADALVAGQEQGALKAMVHP